MNCDNGRVRVAFADAVAELVFDAPDDVNAIDEGLAADFVQGVDAIERSDARVAVIRGADTTFCAGGDLSQSPAAFVRTIETSIDGIVRIYTSDIPYVAAIRGAAIGGGMEIALACDIRIVGTDATLGLPEVSLGIIPPAGAIRFLAQTVGRGRALELLLTGRRFSGEEADSLGIVTEAPPDDEVLDVATALAADVATNSPGALAAIKQSVNEAFPRPIGPATWDLSLAETLAYRGDFEEGKRAFLEGREPEF